MPRAADRFRWRRRARALCRGVQRSRQWTARWPRASFIPGALPSRISSAICAPNISRSGHDARTVADSGLEQRRWPVAGGCAARTYRPGADDGLHECRGADDYVVPGARDLLQPQQADACGRRAKRSGNFLKFVAATADCDNDALLVLAEPAGPTCHLGTRSCFGDEVGTTAERLSFLGELENVIAQRIADKPEGSYTARIWSQGPTRIAQKVGEEGVEVALAAVTQEDDRLIGEAADLLFHLTLLLKSRDLSLSQVVKELEQRHAART